MKKPAPLSLLLLLALALAGAGGEIERLRAELAAAPPSRRQAVVARLAHALTLRGESEQQSQDHQSARETFREALSLLARHETRPSARLLKDAGLTAIILGDHHQALDLLQRAESQARQQGEAELASASAYLLGYVHRDLENFELALKYFHAAYESGQAIGNPRRVIMALNEIGNVHMMQEKFAAALPYKDRALKLARKHGDPELLANGLNDMGEFLRLSGQPRKALPFFREALTIDRRIGHQRGTIITLYSIGRSLFELGRIDESLAALEEARPLAEKAGQNRDLALILSLASKAHEQKGDFRRALAFQRLYHDLWARLFNEEKARQTIEMQTRYEVEKKERENELLQREKQLAALAASRQRGQRNFLFFVSLLVLLLAGVLYRGFRVKARANRWLEEANVRIAAQQAKLEKAYVRMEELARLDPLTGLPNRRAALEELGREERRFRRGRVPFTLVMADLVGFKAVNDALGHDAGDAVLREAAQLFRLALRAQDTVARWGGDEFLLLLLETDAGGAEALCDAIRAKIAAHDFRFEGRPLQVSVSLGAATFGPGLTVEECLRQADQAMYRSRRDGRER